MVANNLNAAIEQLSGGLEVGCNKTVHEKRVCLRTGSWQFFEVARAKHAKKQRNCQGGWSKASGKKSFHLWQSLVGREISFGSVFISKYVQVAQGVAALESLEEIYYASFGSHIKKLKVATCFLLFRGSFFSTKPSRTQRCSLTSLSTPK